MSSISFIVAQKVEEGSPEALAEAMDLLKKAAANFKEQKLEDDLLALKGRLSNLLNAAHKGEIGLEEANVELNKIRLAVLDYKNRVKSLEDKALAKAEIERDKEIETLFFTNAYATQAKDLDMVMKTFHSASHIYELNRQQYAALFQHLTVDLVYEIDYVKPWYKDHEMATVEVQQTTKAKVENVPFRKNVNVQIYTLKKENGQWKIFDSVIKRLEFLDV